MHKQISQTIRVTREISGEYVHAGEIYHTERSANGKGDVWFSRPEGSTYMRQWRFNQELRNGALVAV
jgi:hypothetical protein